MSVNPEYYYNLSGNITDGKKEYSLHHKEDKVGGLSISSGLKERYIEYGTDSLLDLVNNLNDKNNELKAFKEKVFEWIDGEIDSVKESCNILMTSDEAEAVMDTLIELKNELSGGKSE